MKKSYHQTEFTQNVKHEDLVEVGDEWAFGDDETDRSSIATKLNASVNPAGERTDSSKSNMTHRKDLTVSPTYLDTKFETTDIVEVRSSRAPEKHSDIFSKIKVSRGQLNRLMEDKSNGELEVARNSHKQLSQTPQGLKS